MAHGLSLEITKKKASRSENNRLGGGNTDSWL